MIKIAGLASAHLGVSTAIKMNIFKHSEKHIEEKAITKPKRLEVVLLGDMNLIKSYAGVSMDSAGMMSFEETFEVPNEIDGITYNVNVHAYIPFSINFKTSCKSSDSAIVVYNGLDENNFANAKHKLNEYRECLEKDLNIQPVAVAVENPTAPTSSVVNPFYKTITLTGSQHENLKEDDKDKFRQAYLALAEQLVQGQNKKEDAVENTNTEQDWCYVEESSYGTVAPEESSSSEQNVFAQTYNNYTPDIVKRGVAEGVAFGGRAKDRVTDPAWREEQKNIANRKLSNTITTVSETPIGQQTSVLFNRLKGAVAQQIWTPQEDESSSK